MYQDQNIVNSRITTKKLWGVRGSPFLSYLLNFVIHHPILINFSHGGGGGDDDGGGVHLHMPSVESRSVLSPSALLRRSM